MARADLLIDIVKAGAEGDQELFRKALEAMITEERAKQHNIFADRLAAHLNLNMKPIRSMQTAAVAPNGEALYLEIQPHRKLSDLLLPPVVLQACMELAEEHNRVDLLRAHNLEPRNRVLLVGPPGNGKTSLAEALAQEIGSPLFVVRYESIIGSYLGETAVRLAKLFALARVQRCVLFFDEFDVIGKERGDVHETGEIKRVVSSLLLQVDQLPSHVVVVTATNHSELLDRAVWRRFQLRLDLPAPNKSQRMAWLQMFTNRSGLQLGYSHDYLAQHLKDMSFAELEQFAQDVQRRYVLTMPSADMRSIVSDRLKQWTNRCIPKLSSLEDDNGRTSDSHPA
ncbi:MAG TPA: ATP-binding protein [Bacillota bacterium]|nr:ATP-binding protein [Bacillota bacterium]